MRKVLITGANSYIGQSFVEWTKAQHNGDLLVDTVDMIGDEWRNMDFSQYDVVFHVAGIAHSDVGKVSEERKQLYYKVNCDLAVETAEKAKASGVRQFIFMSSMIIYGDSAQIGKQKIITAETEPKPANFYGDSKWQADIRVRKLASNDFNVAVLRPPMIYGKNSKGNYPLLAKLAKKSPVFPRIENQRSMLYINNLCEFVYQLIINGDGGVFFPQNDEYVTTHDLVKLISSVSGKSIAVIGALAPMVKLVCKFSSKAEELANKAFGSIVYDKSLSVYKTDYTVFTLEESIRESESN